MKSWNSVCPVCLRQGVEGTPIPSAVPRRLGQVENRTHSDDAVFVQCPACGKYVVTDCDRENLESERLRTWNPFHLSALLREQTIRHLPPFWLQFGMGPYGPLQREDLAPIDLNELLGRWPRTVPERIERTLCNLARLSPVGGHPLEFKYEDASLAFAETPNEAQFNFKSLIDRNLLKFLHQPSDLVLGVALTSEGWECFDRITRGASDPENPVFVAMWFGVKEKKEANDMTEEDMQRIYDHGIAPAVTDAGYRVTKVNQVHFNDAIIDRVFGDIRAAPFVVADFTGHRNGVYLEAGFGRGLGRPVIHTCAESHRTGLHFDTKHLHHIFWKDAAHLKERLFQQIRGSIGIGPHSTARL